MVLLTISANSPQAVFLLVTIISGILMVAFLVGLLRTIKSRLAASVTVEGKVTSMVAVDDQYEYTVSYEVSNCPFHITLKTGSPRSYKMGSRLKLVVEKSNPSKIYTKKSLAVLGVCAGISGLVMVLSLILMIALKPE